MKSLTVMRHQEDLPPELSILKRQPQEVSSSEESSEDLPPVLSILKSQQKEMSSSNESSEDLPPVLSILKCQSKEEFILSSDDNDHQNVRSKM